MTSNDPISPLAPWGRPVAPAPHPATGPGPLAGVRLAVKDMIDIAGQPTGAGHPAWLASHEPATAHAEVVARLLGAGAGIVGKTHTDEFAYSLFGTNAHYGSPDNPAAPGRLTGGSSSGSAAAVAAGLADLALGTDTAGSVRVPSAWCGLYGLRPTHARVSRRGVVPLAPSFDAPGPMARDLALLARATGVLLTGVPLGGDPSGLLLPADLWDLADPAVRDALRPAAAVLGGHLPSASEPLFAPGGDAPDYRAAYTVRQSWEFWQEHGDWVREHRPAFGPGVTARVAGAAARTRSEVDEADAVIAATRAVLGRALDGGRIIVAPTTPVTAPRRGTPAGAELRLRILGLTLLASVAGLPALTVPVAVPSGPPAGLSLLGPAGSDEQLIALAGLLI